MSQTSPKKLSIDQTMDKNWGFMSCDKLDRVAYWVGTNVATAFFASLERCSCINLSTTDLEDEEEAKDRPLMFSRPTEHDGLQPTTTTTTASDVNKLHV